MEQYKKFPSVTPNYQVLTGDSPMPFGQHKGVPMKNVPAKDLLWLKNHNKASKSVLAYITDNYDDLCTRAGVKPRKYPL